jgi:hypothetical protein
MSLRKCNLPVLFFRMFSNCFSVFLSKKVNRWYLKSLSEMSKDDNSNFCLIEFSFIQVVTIALLASNVFVNFVPHRLKMKNIFILHCTKYLDWVAQSTIKVEVLLKLIVNYFCCTNVSYNFLIYCISPKFIWGKGFLLCQIIHCKLSITVIVGTKRHKYLHGIHV